MYSVLLIDDEPWALLGLKNSIEWQCYNMEIVGETTDSEEALTLMCEKKPDVVFTDIKMPVYSGLDLIKIAKSENLNTEFVIVSGFKEFEWAQEAIQFDVVSYILKPIEVESLEKLIIKLQVKLQEKEQKKDLPTITDLLNNSTNENKDIRLALEKWSEHENQPDIRFLMSNRNINDHLKQIQEINVELAIKMKGDEMLYLLSCTYNAYDILKSHAKIITNQNIKIGLSNPIKKGSDFIHSLKEADIAYKHNFIDKEQRIHKYNAKSNTVINGVIDSFSKALKEKNDDEILTLLSGLPRLFHAHSFDIDQVAEFYNQAVYLINKFIPFIGEEPLEYLDYEHLYQRYKTFPNLCKNLIEKITSTSLVECMIEFHPAICDNFRSLLQYINNNYMGTITLEDLSKRFSLNISYICSLFKKVTGKTFVSYLTEIRLHHACHLLKETHFTISEIAEKVGYKDLFYFDKVFKKKFHSTPIQYRKEVK